MNTNDLNFVIAVPTSKGIWNLYPTRDVATEALAKLQAERPDEFAGASVLTYDDWHSQMESELLADGIKEIDNEDYWYALEVLPPLQWHSADGVTRFCMSEFTRGNITNQYASISCDGVERYFVKPVRFNDRSTYITTDDIREYDELLRLLALTETLLARSEAL